MESPTAMNGSEYLDPYLGSQEGSLSYDAPHQYYETQSYIPDRGNPVTVLPRSEKGAPRTPDDSILQDDKNLFENYDRFLAGYIDQQEFQASCCKRLLFIWEWVFQFCFWNFPSALRSWYQILEREDIWLWVDGDEVQGPLHRLIRPSWQDCYGPTDMYSSCILSQAELQHGVDILRNRIHQEFDAQDGLSPVDPSKRLLSSLPWHRRLGQHPDALLRYAAVMLKIATSVPIQALDSARRIKGRKVTCLFKEVVGQFQPQNGICVLTCTPWDRYVAKMRRLGHTCICPNTYHDAHICILLEFLEVFTPGYPVTSPIEISMSSKCQCCPNVRPLLNSDISWNGEEPAVQRIDEFTPAAVPSDVLRFLWFLWFISGETDVRNWLHWLASWAHYTRCTDFEHRSRARLILACLVSPELEAWITTHHDSMYRHSRSKQYCFNSGEVIGIGIPYQWNHAMYIPTPDDWKAAEAALSKAESVLESAQKVPDILATLGVLFHWISTRSVATPLPDIDTFRNLLTDLWECLEEDLPEISEDAVPSDVKSRIVQADRGCCPQVDEKVLDWYIASAALLTPKNEINRWRMRICRCDLTTSEDVTRVFNNYFTSECDDGSIEVGEVCRALVAIAQRHGYDASIFSRTTGDSDISDNEAEEDERITPTTIIIPRKPSKSHQIEAVKTHILNQLRELESATRQIPALLSAGKQKATLPWKTLTQILKERGYELKNWPVEVPLPGSGSEFCDDNKGIHGLNAKHLRALYEATQDREKPLGFRKVGEMVSATVRMEEAARRRGTMRGREESEEREAGPSKRRRVDSNGAGPSWDRS